MCIDTLRIQDMFVMPIPCIETIGSDVIDVMYINMNLRCMIYDVSDFLKYIQMDIICVKKNDIYIYIYIYRVNDPYMNIIRIHLKKEKHIDTIYHVCLECTCDRYDISHIHVSTYLPYCRFVYEYVYTHLIRSHVCNHLSILWWHSLMICWVSYLGITHHSL